MCLTKIREKKLKRFFIKRHGAIIPQWQIPFIVNTIHSLFSKKKPEGSCLGLKKEADRRASAFEQGDREENCLQAVQFL